MLFHVLVWCLGASNVAMALVVFLVMARPEHMLGWLCHLHGMRDIWRAGKLSAADEAKLLGVAVRLRAPMLVLLFGWSFVSGAILTWSQIG